MRNLHQIISYTCSQSCVILTGFNKYKTIIKSLTSLEIKITEIMKRHQHIIRLQSKANSRKKVYWCKTRWGYSKALLSREKKIWVTATSCHTQNSISWEINKSWQKLQTQHCTQCPSHHLTHHWNQSYIT